MTDFINEIRNRHDLFYKVFLFLVSIFLIVYLFPKEATFKYDFQRNQPWKYETLIAPYDIPVYRTDLEIKKDQEEIKKSKKFYFDFNKQKEQEKLELFQLKLNKTWDVFFNTNQGLFGFLKGGINKKANSKAQKAVYKSEGEKIIKYVYNRGVVKLSKEVDLLNDSAKFYVRRNNYYAATFLNDLFTPKSAFEYSEKIIDDNKKLNSKYLHDLLEQVFNKNSSNISFNTKETKRVLDQKLEKIVLMERTIKEGYRIIEKGAPIDDENFKVLKSFETKYKSKKISKFSKYTIAFGQTLLVAILMTCLLLYLRFFRRKFLENNKNLVFMLFVITSFVVLTSLGLRYELFNIYIVPICLAPIITRSFFDTRTAFFVHLVIVLLLGFIVPNGFHFIFLQLVAGMMGIYGFANFRNRSQLFLTTFIIALSYAVCYIALNIIIEGDFSEIDWSSIGYLGISALLTLLAYPLIYAFEKVFSFISDVTLLELADTNNKLLRELSRKAPGTFQHSLQVANLAEAVTGIIGGNTLLIRTAALYHDIGKMEAPMYYIENQSTGLNPHDELGYEESAQIIINHVHKGVEIAKKNGVPDKIIDFIRTHHGTTKTAYFFKMFMNENPDQVEEDVVGLFTYPGPIPFSKESAALMMADSVEAASRSLKEPDVESIEKLVESIISNQIKDGQFENADITLRDIRLIKKMFKKMLMNIYHVRIEYPH
ncbi:MAG: hypothetical protein CMD18_04885 [Flavobacteriales bacterium]|nr:hypothetical protein [Flavobacteriales bacterium]|tara:strand:+ start:5220 stop:7349 length:2130 start_codon:yes stop_codon:yes gene_type:complete